MRTGVYSVVEAGGSLCGMLHIAFYRKALRFVLHIKTKKLHKKNLRQPVQHSPSFP